MLIYLEKDIVIKFKNSNYTESELEYLERIIASHINSQHYIFSDRKSLIFLSEFQELSTTARSYLKKLEQQYTTIAGYLKGINNRISVVDVATPYFEKNESQSFVEYKVSIDYFNNPRTLDCAKLITENMDDCNFYKDLLKYYPEKLPSMLFEYSMDSHDGNGHGITKTYTDKIQNQNCIIAIVDSDMKHPKDCFGDTSKNLNKIYEEYKNKYITKFVTLPLHEKENLLPYELYKALNIGNGTLEKLDVIFKNADMEDFFYFFDYKDGLSTDNYSEFYEKILEVEGILDEYGSEDDIFYGSKKDFLEYINLRANNKLIFPKKYILKPLGENILKEFSVQKMSSYVNKKICILESKEEIPGDLIELYKRIHNILKNPFDFLLPMSKRFLGDLCKCLMEWGLCKPKNATG